MVNFDNIKAERTSPLQSENLDETSRTISPDSATSSDDDDVPTTQSESNLAVLTKLFPHLDKQILVIVLKACENNLFRSIQSLAQDSSMRQCKPILPRVPNTQQLPLRMPMHRLPVFQPLPHSPTFVSPPRMLQSSGLQFAAFYPGPMNLHGPNPVGFVPRAHGNTPGTKHPWCFPISDGPLHKKPLLSKSVVDASERRKTGVIKDCPRCQNILNVGDRFCSQCGNSV